MGYSGTVMILYPPSLLLIASVLLIITFAIVYIMKAVLRLSKADINGSLVAFTFMIWAINLAALALALIIMDFITLSIPFFDVIHAEFSRSIPRDSSLPEIIYITSLALLHAALLLSSYPAFRKKIRDSAKRNEMFAAFVISSVLIWAIIMCFELVSFDALKP